jgi:hypothetical protein
MEIILENLSMDATAGKLKAITDACDEGLGKTRVLVESSCYSKGVLNFLFSKSFRGFIT